MNTDHYCQMDPPGDSSVALLIDGENGSASRARAILIRTEEWGEAVVRRVYGDWSSPQMRPWRDMVTQLGMRAVHQHLPKKNAADIALTADAVDLFYQGFRRFCLVSGDSDYVPLVLWLMEHRCLVVVISQNDAPVMLQRACSVFVSTDQLSPDTMTSAPAMQQKNDTLAPQKPASPTIQQKRVRPRGRKKRTGLFSSPSDPQNK
jgi:hypothetical protein